MRPRPSLRDDNSSDFVLKAAGVAIAVGISGAATLEIASNTGAPKINGLQHLALFAQPARVRDERLRIQLAPKAGIDYEPTASISKEESGAYRVRAVERNRVTLEGPGGVVRVKIGEAVGRGRLIAIVGGEGEWRPVIVRQGGQTSR